MTAVWSRSSSPSKTADDIQSSVTDVTATDDSAQSAENESPVDDTTDTSQIKDKKTPTP